MTLRLLCCFIMVMILAAEATPAAAGMITIDGTTTGHTDLVERVIGWEFTVGGAPIILTELGAFDFDKGGLVDSHEVGVWMTDKTLVVSGTIASGTSAPLEGFFRFVDVGDVTLAANTTYIIGATWDADGDELVNDTGATNAVTSFSVDPLISLPTPGSGTARFNDFSSAFAFPEKTDASEFGGTRNAFWGPNFKAQAVAVPEPSSAALLGMGGLALIGYGWRRRRNPKMAV